VRHLAAYSVFQQQQLAAARVPQVIRTLFTVEVLKRSKLSGKRWTEVKEDQEEEFDTSSLLGCLQVRRLGVVLVGGNRCNLCIWHGDLAWASHGHGVQHCNPGGCRDRGKAKAVVGLEAEVRVGQRKGRGTDGAEGR
jgi:hypothetical protein